MKLSNRSTNFLAFVVSIMGLGVGSCTTSQPEFECSAQNHTAYQLRYYKDEANSTCPADSGYITGSLLGGTAGMESYILLSPDGGGGPDVYFTNTTDKIDRSATKIGLRLDTLLSAESVNACDDNLMNNCSSPDSLFGCSYCLKIVGDGGAGTTYTLPDGTNGDDVVLLPDGGKQGVQKPTADGGVKRISLTNSCVPGKKDNVLRKANTTPDPNLFLIVPRYGPKGICTSIDGGSATSKAVFPATTCQDLTTLPASEITTTLSNYRLLASSAIPGLAAKAQITFEEKLGSNASCKNVYNLVIMTPQVECHTDLDCSPDPVPTAPKCKPDSLISDYCYSGSGAGTILGSGISPFLIGKTSDGKFDLKNKCDPDLNFCIWNTDAGGL